ncbi:DNA-binding response regulator [Bacillus sp. J14TS2]|uniref:response regulator n=1 Tax=unclassified Bacillus (in: firmicutes) TaxID=185979 RepID=UPI001A9663FA|nr:MULTISPECIES: response regulator transcription factor [unclassified Bacillus (in: firmicutes)]MBO0993591.1 response regulator transcription factor [Bacillus sp. SD088]GIN73824.1 DNA-binding response regulator [Bacillus sp. J14TS2]
MTIQVLIADDHHVVRRGLVFFLQTQKDIQIVGEAKNGKEAVKLTMELKPDVVLMDLVMPVMDGIDATAKIKEMQPETEILILTSFSDQDHVIPAIEAGASGYQLKDIEPDELVHSIRKLIDGENTLHPKATNLLMNRMNQSSRIDHPISGLTIREKQVLTEISKGKSNKEIGAYLNITEKTVKTHVSNIFIKLDVADRTQAALYAVKNGFVKP